LLSKKKKIKKRKNERKYFENPHVMMSQDIGSQLVDMVGCTCGLFLANVLT